MLHSLQEFIWQPYYNYQWKKIITYVVKMTLNGIVFVLKLFKGADRRELHTFIDQKKLCILVELLQMLVVAILWEILPSYSIVIIAPKYYIHDGGSSIFVSISLRCKHIMKKRVRSKVVVYTLCYEFFYNQVIMRKHCTTGWSNTVVWSRAVRLWSYCGGLVVFHTLKHITS